MKKRVHVYYTGRVQGVGFRMTAEDVAHEHGIVGWVKNLRDGRVEIVAEGEEKALRTFLDTIRTGFMKNFIRQVDATWSEASGTFDDFTIRY